MSGLRRAKVLPSRCPDAAIVMYVYDTLMVAAYSMAVHTLKLCSLAVTDDTDVGLVQGSCSATAPPILRSLGWLSALIRDIIGR